MRMDKYNVFTLGLVGGVMLFFLGMAANIVLGPASDSFILPRQVSAVLKLTGMGIVCISMIVGAVFVDRIEKDSRYLIVIFGVVLLLVNLLMMSYTKWY